MSQDKLFYDLSKQSQDHLRQGKLGMYACDLYSMSEVNRKEKMYDKQLYSLTISAYIHLSGVDTLEDYSYWKNGDFSVTRPRPLLPPAVVRNLSTCTKKLSMSIEQYEEFYFDVIEPTLTPAHVFGIKGTWDIIHAYLNGEDQKAEKLIAGGTKKFIKDLSRKGR